MRCSLEECGEEIVGSVTIIGGEEADIDWGDGISEDEVYHGVRPEDHTKTSYVVLHPNCFKKLYDEILRQEGEAAFTLILGPVGTVKDMLGIPK